MKQLLSLKMNLTEQNKVLWFVIIASIIESIIKITTLTLINNDAIVYLRAAEAFNHAGTHAAFAIYPWPFYSILIALFHKMTLLSYENAAYLLNTILVASICGLFVTLARVLRGSISVQWWAAITVLTIPLLIDLRPFILRDFGYWAFYLSAILMALQYIEKQKNIYVLGWLSSLVIATLFRIEGVLLLLCTPFAFIVIRQFSWRKRLTDFIKFQTLSVMGLFIMSYNFITNPNLLIENTGRLYNVFYQIGYFNYFISHTFIAKTQLIATEILSQYSIKDARVFTLGGLIAYYVFVFLNNGTFIPLLFSWIAAKKKCLLPDPAVKMLLLTIIAINIALTAISTIEGFFLSNRYLVALLLVLLLAAPFGMDILWRNPLLKIAPMKWQRCMIVLLLTYLLISGLCSFGASKHFVYDSAIWLRTHVSKENKIYSNSRPILYYGQVMNPDWEQFNGAQINDISVIQKHDLNSYDILALYIPHIDRDKVPGLLKGIHTQTLRVFTNSRHDEVLILKVVKQPASESYRSVVHHHQTSMENQ
jgi:hypothetical protein